MRSYITAVRCIIPDALWSQMNWACLSLHEQFSKMIQTMTKSSPRGAKIVD